MNTPHLPGFTAEAALYPTSRSYRTAAGPAAFAGVSAAASFMGSAGSRRGCNPNCVCVTEEGCPCCPTGKQPPIARNYRLGGQVVDCLPGSEAACISLCDDAGGGMMSNPDGTISCVIY